MQDGDSSSALTTQNQRKGNPFANFMSRLFVKNYQDTSNPLVKKRYGYLGSIYGLVTNIMLFAAKLISAYVFNLDTLRADAINNASDIGMCVIALVSVFMASRPASKEHPYGSARFEYVGSFIIALLVIMLSFSQVTGTFQEVMDTTTNWEKDFPSYSEPRFYVSFAVMCCSVLIKLSQFLLLTGLAKKTESMTLMATGTDARNDSMVSLAIAISLLLSFPIGFNVDPITAILVSALVCFSGFMIANEAASAILGKAPDKGTIMKFAAAIREYPIVLGIHDLEMHTYGSNMVHAYVHVEVDAATPIMVIKDEIDFIEKDMEKKTGIRTFIHIDPIMIGDPDTVRLRSYVLEAAREVDTDISVNDFRVVTNPTDASKKRLVFDLVLPYDLLPKEESVIQRIKAITRSFTGETLSFDIDVDDRTSDLLLMLADKEKIS